MGHKLIGNFQPFWAWAVDRGEDFAAAREKFVRDQEQESEQKEHWQESKRAGGRGRALVPGKNAGNVSSAWTNSISCTYFVPFCADAKMKHFW